MSTAVPSAGRSVSRRRSSHPSRETVPDWPIATSIRPRSWTRASPAAAPARPFLPPQPVAPTPPTQPSAVPLRRAELEGRRPHRGCPPRRRQPLRRHQADRGQHRDRGAATGKPAIAGTPGNKHLSRSVPGAIITTSPGCNPARLRTNGFGSAGEETGHGQEDDSRPDPRRGDQRCGNRDRPEGGEVARRPSRGAVHRNPADPGTARRAGRLLRSARLRTERGTADGTVLRRAGGGA